MLALDADLTMKVFLLNVNRGHFSRKVFSLNCNCRQKIGKRSLFGSTYAAFHHCGVKAEQCSVSFGTDDSKATGINATLIQYAGKRMFGFCKFGTSLDTFIIEKPLMYKFSPAGLNCEVILSESNLRFTRVAILCDQIAGISCQHQVIYLTLSV